MDIKNSHVLNLSLIKERFLKNFNYININENITGQKVGENCVILGCRVGNEITEQGFIHEFSHLVEIDVERVIMHNWGLYMKNTEFFNGQIFCNPISSQASMREIRVFAYQHSINKEFGIQDDLIHSAKSLDFMPDWIFMTKKEEEDRKKYLRISEMIADLSEREFTIEKFEKELKIRKKFIENFFLKNMFKKRTSNYQKQES